MRIFFLFLFCFIQFSNAKIPERFSSSKYCIGCHVQKGIDWETTWHSKSNSEKDTLYKKSIQFISDMTFKSIENVDIKCGQCHSPKMGVKTVDASYEMAKVLGIQTDETKKIENKIHNETSDDGISCIICHNITKIKHSKDLNTRGFKDVVFGASNIMNGPFSESSRTSYHKMQKKEYFKEDANKLCFVCHYGYKNNKMYDYATGVEYNSANSTKKCVDCHMGKLEKSIIASRVTGKTKAILRNTRRHLFKGARNSDILKKALKISVEKINSSIIVSIENITPHNVPTGFSGRELEISVAYKNNLKIIKKITKKINALYVDKSNLETLSYIAVKKVYDKRLKPHETRVFKIENFKNSNSVQIDIYYRLIKSSLVPILGIKDPIFLKKYKIYSTSLAL